MITQRRKHNGSGQTLWAYGYQLAPHVARGRLVEMQSILDAGHAAALERAEIWEGRLINGDDITDILVVSDTPAQDGDINRRLEAELVRLEARYSVSAPLEIDPDSRRPRPRRFPRKPTS